MKVLSLLQPWAQLCVTKSPLGDFAIKSWETRSWRPTSAKMINHITTHGMLIHASKAMAGWQKKLFDVWPFSLYRDLIMTRGAIIGWVSVGRIMPTEQWLEEIRYQDRDDERWAEEEKFGDYSAGRYAWELLEFKQLAEPIPIKGSLSLWDFDLNMEYAQWKEGEWVQDTCPNCNGTGKVEYGIGNQKPEIRYCPKCKGLGTIDKEFTI